jgi:hypothetical protein
MKKHETEAWEHAYAVVVQYLTDHKLDITMQTTGWETNIAAPPSLQDDQSADEQLGGLLESAPGKMPVKERIAKAKREKPRTRPKTKAVTISSAIPTSEPTPVKLLGKKSGGSMTSDSDQPSRRTPSGSGRKTGAKIIQKKALVKSSDKPGTTPLKDSKTLVIQSPARTKKDVSEDSEASDVIVEDVRPRRSKK